MASIRLKQSRALMRCKGTVFGAPVERQVEATAVEVPWWKQAQQQFRLIVAFAGGIVFGIFGAKRFL